MDLNTNLGQRSEAECQALRQTLRRMESLQARDRERTSALERRGTQLAQTTYGEYGTRQAEFPYRLAAEIRYITENMRARADEMTRTRDALRECLPDRAGGRGLQIGPGHYVTFLRGLAVPAGPPRPIRTPVAGSFRIFQGFPFMRPF